MTEEHGRFIPFNPTKLKPQIIEALTDAYASLRGAVMEPSIFGLFDSERCAYTFDVYRFVHSDARTYHVFAFDTHRGRPCKALVDTVTIYPKQQRLRIELALTKRKTYRIHNFELQEQVCNNVL